MDFTIPCVFCKYLNRDSRTKMSCIAFPNGIPKQIQELKVIHTTPFKGDNGIVYEPLDETMDYFLYFSGEVRE